MASIWTLGEALVEIMRPRADMPLDAADVFMGPFPSGAPAIFADMAARLSHQAGLIARLGDDAFGRCVVDRLWADGVDVRYMQTDKQGSTACAFVTYASTGERNFLFHLADTPAARATAPQGQLPKAAFFHVMGCSLTVGKGLAQEIQDAARRFRAEGAAIAFDPNFRPELLGGADFAETVAPILEMCTVLLPGEEELMRLTGASTVSGAIDAVFQKTSVQVIALKRGKAGCRIVTVGEDFTVSAYPVRAVDPTGAGDCFDAAFLCGLAEGMELAQCARFASAAAALNTQALGPMEGGITRERVEELMRSHPEI